MNLDFSADDHAFRQAARAWLSENVPGRHPTAGGPDHRAFATDWLAKLKSAGWSGVAWPTEFGGQGLPPHRLLIWFEEYVRAHAPTVLDCTFVGLNHAGPTIMACGSDDQKAYHLPRILSGEAIWCQGFSEPNAGSDLASLKTQGRVEGDKLIVNGQKIWSSYADIADFQELLIRTEPGSKRHAGLSWVICDMHAPGITVRPIENIAGSSHFAEVFYDDVEIPLTNVVNGLGNGWATAMITLGFERKTAALALQLQLCIKIDELIAATNPVPGSATAERLGLMRAEAAALRAMTYRTVLRDGGNPSEGSLMRLSFAELAQRVHRAEMDLLGIDRLTASPATEDYLESYSETIAGGTAEVQRNIIAERVLGLPREPRP